MRPLRPNTQMRLDIGLLSELLLTFGPRVSRYGPEGGERLLQFKAEIYVTVLDNSDSLDRDRAVMIYAPMPFHYESIAQKAPLWCRLGAWTTASSEAFCSHKYPGSKQ